MLRPDGLHARFPLSSALTGMSLRPHRNGNICSKEHQHVTILTFSSQGSIAGPNTVNTVVRSVALGLTGRARSPERRGRELEPKASPETHVHLQMSAQREGWVRAGWERASWGKVGGGRGAGGGCREAGLGKGELGEGRQDEFSEKKREAGDRRLRLGHFPRLPWVLSPVRLLPEGQRGTGCRNA